MKNLITAIIATLFFCLPNLVFAQLSIDGPAGSERIEVIFSHNQDFNDLVKIKLDLAERGIAVDYRKLEFNNEGQLTAIDFRVDCGDGFSGTAATEYVNNNRGADFFRDYGQNVQCPFGTGIWEKGE